MTTARTTHELKLILMDRAESLRERRQIKKAGKKRLLELAREAGINYDPPHYFGTNVQVTEVRRDYQVVRNEEGKIIGTLAVPEKTYEERRAEAEEARRQEDLIQAARSGASTPLPADQAKREEVIKAAQEGTRSRILQSYLRKRPQQQPAAQTFLYPAYVDYQGRPVTKPTQFMRLEFIPHKVTTEPGAGAGGVSYVDMQRPSKYKLVRRTKDLYSAANVKLSRVTEPLVNTLFDVDFQGYTDYARSNPIYMQAQGAIKGSIVDLRDKPVKFVGLTAVGYVTAGVGRLAGAAPITRKAFEYGIAGLGGLYAGSKAVEYQRAATDIERGAVIGRMFTELGALKLGTRGYSATAAAITRTRPSEITANIRFNDVITQSRATASNFEITAGQRLTSPLKFYQLKGKLYGKAYQANVLYDVDTGISRSNILYKGQVYSRAYRFIDNTPGFKPRRVIRSIDFLYKPEPGALLASRIQYREGFKGSRTYAEDAIEETVFGRYDTRTELKFINQQAAISKALATPAIRNIKSFEYEVTPYGRSKILRGIDAEAYPAGFTFGKKGKLPSDVLIAEITEGGYKVGYYKQSRLRQGTLIYSKQYGTYKYTRHFYYKVPEIELTMPKGKKAQLGAGTFNKGMLSESSPKIDAQKAISPRFSRLNARLLSGLVEPARLSGLYIPLGAFDSADLTRADLTRIGTRAELRLQPEQALKNQPMIENMLKVDSIADIKAMQAPELMIRSRVNVRAYAEYRLASRLSVDVAPVMQPALAPAMAGNISINRPVIPENVPADIFIPKIPELQYGKFAVTRMVKSRRGKQQFEYKADITSVVFNIRADKALNNLTGLELRPIINNKSSKDTNNLLRGIL